MIDWPVILWRILGFVVALGLPFGAGFYVESKRWESADNARIAAEAKAEKARLDAIADAVDEQDTKAYAVAQQYEAQRQQLENAYAAARTKLKAALSRPLVCADGGTVGDVVIPAGALDGLRVATGSGGISAPEAAASHPGR